MILIQKNVPKSIENCCTTGSQEFFNIFPGNSCSLIVFIVIMGYAKFEGLISLRNHFAQNIFLQIAFFQFIVLENVNQN